MRIMALDIGKVRCGIAISDPQEKIATPLCVLPTEEVRANAPAFAAYAKIGNRAYSYLACLLPWVAPKLPQAEVYPRGCPAGCF